MKRLLSFLHRLFQKQYHIGEERFSSHAHTYTEREAQLARRRVALSSVEKFAL